MNNILKTSKRYIRKNVNSKFVIPFRHQNTIYVTYGLLDFLDFLVEAGRVRYRISRDGEVVEEGDLDFHDNMHPDVDERLENNVLSCVAFFLYGTTNWKIKLARSTK